MSTSDIQLDTVCDHFVVKEPLVISDDYRTLNLMRPLSSQVGVKVYINNIEAPSNHDYSGWDLVIDSYSIHPAKRNVQFRDVRNSKTDIFEVSYYTTYGNCRKCHSQKVYDDLSFTEQGHFLFAENEMKLAQDVGKIVITVIGSNFHHTWYGTNLLNFLGSAADPNFFKIQISSDITKAIRKLIDLQTKQKLYQTDYLDNRELIGSISYVDVRVHETNQTRINAKVGIISVSNELIEINRSFRI